jgi:hypothetical protein
MFVSSRASRSYDESREECESDERRCEAPSGRGEVQATRLFDKLDQLEKRWQSQKTHQRKAVLPQASSGREQPEPCLVSTFSTVATSFDSERAVGRSDSFASTVSARSEKRKTKKAPRIVSMFDRLYQKGKAKSITRGRTMLQQSKPKVNRNKRRQHAAAVIQAVFRGKKFRKKLKKLSGNAKTIQQWWRDVSQRLFYLRLRGSTLIIQSLQRRRRAIQQLQRKRKAVIVLQSCRRVYLAKRKRLELIRLREKRINESNASSLIQGMMIKHNAVLRTDIVDCKSLMVE